MLIRSQGSDTHSASFLPTIPCYLSCIPKAFASDQFWSWKPVPHTCKFSPPFLPPLHPHACVPILGGPTYFHLHYEHHFYMINRVLKKLNQSQSPVCPIPGECFLISSHGCTFYISPPPSKQQWMHFCIQHLIQRVKDHEKLVAILPRETEAGKAVRANRKKRKEKKNRRKNLSLVLKT